MAERGQVEDAVNALHDAFGLTDGVATTYQAAGGAGQSGITELIEQTAKLVQDPEVLRSAGAQAEASVTPSTFSKAIAFNVLQGMARGGKLEKETLVWREGTADWVKAGTVHMLRMLELTGHGHVPVAQGAAFPLINSRELTAAWEAQYGEFSYKGAWNPGRYHEPDVVPVRNVAAIAPALDLSGEAIAERQVAAAVGAALARLELDDGRQPVALCLRWQGSATFQRLDALARGLLAGLEPVLVRGHPLILVADSDIGGLIGIHCREELALANDIISIDGIALKEFDFVDIGALLEQTGAVPVAIKSLVFPGEAAASLGGVGTREGRPAMGGAVQ